jgi:hypothetical protein
MIIEKKGRKMNDLSLKWGIYRTLPECAMKNDGLNQEK